MGKSGKIAAGLFGASFAAIGALSIMVYATSPQINHSELISDSAQYILEYQGEDPSVPLDYTLARLEIAKQDNPSLEEDISKLITEAEAIKSSSDVMESPLLYGMAMDSLERNLFNYANSDRYGLELGVGILAALIGLSVLGGAIFTKD